MNTFLVTYKHADIGCALIKVIVVCNNQTEAHDLTVQSDSDCVHVMSIERLEFGTIYRIEN